MRIISKQFIQQQEILDYIDTYIGDSVFETDYNKVLIVDEHSDLTEANYLVAETLSADFQVVEYMDQLENYLAVCVVYSADGFLIFFNKNVENLIPENVLKELSS